MDIPARRQLANVTRSATGELPAQSIQWWVVQLAAEVVDPDGRIVDQWTPLWIRAQLLDEPAASQARAILAAIDQDRLTHHRGGQHPRTYGSIGRSASGRSRATVRSPQVQIQQPSSSTSRWSERRCIMVQLR